MNSKGGAGGQLWEAIAAIVIGLLFVIWPGNVLRWAVLFIGVISLVAGIIQFIVYFTGRKKSQPVEFPLVGLLILIWGILLLAQPEVWVNLFMVVMSIPMILLAIGQLLALSRKKKSGYAVPAGYYVFPVLFLLAGVIVMFNPFASALWLVLFVGICVIAYGVADMVNYFSLRRV